VHPASQSVASFFLLPSRYSAESLRGIRKPLAGCVDNPVSFKILLPFSHRYKTCMPSSDKNMLKKSNTSAVVMSSLALLSVLFTLAFWELLRNPSLLQDPAQPQPAFSGNVLIAWIAAFAFLFIIFVLPGAFVIHKWDDAYFGKEGAIRWVIFGIMFGCLAQLRLLIPKAALQRSSSSFFLEQLLGLVVSFVVFYGSHFFAFKFLKGKRH